MNWNTFFLTTYEVLLTIIFSLITVFITKVVLNRTLLKKDLDGDHNNIAVSLISGTTILCILMLVNSSVLPAVDTLNVMVATGEKLTAGMFLTSFLWVRQITMPSKKTKNQLVLLDFTNCSKAPTLPIPTLKTPQEAVSPADCPVVELNVAVR